MKIQKRILNKKDNTMSEPVQLKYLFVAQFDDGRVINQTPEDKSIIDPEKRSQFYDVLQHPAKLEYFTLVGDGNVIKVDLRSGIFYVNGLAVLLESEKLPTIPDKFDLIFYRQHTHHFNLKHEEIDHNIEYFIGWKCKIKGKTYQQKLAVA